jgi:hypothetical protein
MKEVVESAKENAVLIEEIKKVTKQELEWLAKCRECDSMVGGSVSWKVALLCDPVRCKILECKTEANRKLLNISNIKNNIFRLHVQIEKSQITEVMRNGVVMNESEVRNLIKENKDISDREFVSLRQILGQLRMNVGHMDYNRKIIMTVDQFDAFVSDIEKELLTYGYQLFGELDGV